MLDLSPILPAGGAADALRRSVDLVGHAERLGFRRYWVAEHHNIPGVASAATAVLIGRLAAATSTIRVGAGGIRLPIHAPLAVAEQFGTLEALFPGRIDLGLGRAPGGDPATARALRRTLGTRGEDFPELLDELRGFFREATPGQPVRAIPGEGLRVPIWLLSSSGFSARLAARLGLPFGFAGQFAPQAMEASFALYRREFVPSADLAEPYALAGINVIVAPTDDEARFLATSHQQSFLNLIRGRPGPLPPPVESMDGLWSPDEERMVGDMLAATVVGGPETVRRGLESLLERTGADELMANAAIHDHAARVRSYALLAELWF
ncbi:MAG: LLM class flavin-dependent oxidoreductase [Verrucomicrobiota bacterium]